MSAKALTPRRAGLTLLCVVSCAVPGSIAAEAAPTAAGPEATASACNSIRFGERRYVFFRDHMRCRKAKRLARKVRREKRLDGWRCESGTHFTTGGGCNRRGGRAFFGWHPAD